VRRLVKWVLLVLAAGAVLIVLLTPALDDLPCTIGEHTRCEAQSRSAITILWFLSVPLPVDTYQCSTISKVSRVKDVLSSDCSLVC
jgi:hypothetical protein